MPQYQTKDNLHRSDEELMLSYKNGEESAFDELVGRYMDGIMNYLYKYTGDYNEADDIAQESFIRLFKYKDKYNEEMKFSSWFYTIVINRARSSMSAKTGKEYSSLDEVTDDEIANSGYYSDPADEDEASHYDYENEIKTEYIKKAFDKIDPQYREVIILRYDREMEYSKISELLEIPVGTVKSRINRGRGQLKEIINNEYEGII